MTRMPGIPRYSAHTGLSCCLSGALAFLNCGFLRLGFFMRALCTRLAGILYLRAIPSNRLCTANTHVRDVGVSQTPASSRTMPKCANRSRRVRVGQRRLRRGRYGKYRFLFRMVIGILSAMRIISTCSLSSTDASWMRCTHWPQISRLIAHLPPRQRVRYLSRLLSLTVRLLAFGVLRTKRARLKAGPGLDV